jgi:hypothetical protein
MSVTWETPKLKLELTQGPDFGRPPYLAHLIPDCEREGIVIDCSGEECMREAEFWVSCGGLRQSLCGVCEFICHARWHGRS